MYDYYGNPIDSYVYYYPAFIRQLPYQYEQPSQELRPYLTTWPYSNVYYGNYYES
ncbi:hypothetical protein ACRS6Y_15695 [Bacillus cytotoxicus]|uniref:Uncharacterized protein n=2 Tax=Bacillus cytotoxicus TaxID=580165 RepID=A0AAX2CKV8_9BACI|nr:MULTISPECIES: hypothetical protein [Bacillus cereus group]ABS23057.1 conserved hypothetical protein [Bacillus cytotoxicus NVH 391-98]MDH2858667.1 hypothetical protein [Bacillus cytotoxicus]MDH2863430.1 hypothetical protein [Bacillus cytotoxicus]MDH2866987.1 hypothetical protein [Bacillus cytotoxicus]MDH2871150.1 hypothetical protein [Bacillus cytotoxicus]